MIERVEEDRQQHAHTHDVIPNPLHNAPGATTPLLLLPMPAAKLPPKTALAIMPPLSTRDVRA